MSFADRGRCGRPPLGFDLPVEEVAELLGGPVRIERRWVRTEVVGGWHAASGLPKPADAALVAGSVFVLRPSGAVDAATLAGLVSNGLGLRRVEGFGVVDVNPAPWRFPAPVVGPQDVSVPRFTFSGPRRGTRQWLAARVRERATAVELGRPVPGMPEEQRRMRDLPPTVQEDVPATRSTRLTSISSSCCSISWEALNDRVVPRRRHRGR